MASLAVRLTRLAVQANGHQQGTLRTESVYRWQEPIKRFKRTQNNIHSLARHESIDEAEWPKSE